MIDSDWRRTTLVYHPGLHDVRTAFVLAVPGRKDRDAERPAAGDTGKNLDRILIQLNIRNPAAFPSTHRYDYRIANALGIVPGTRIRHVAC